MPLTRTQLVVMAATACVAVLAVLLHYEASAMLSRFVASARMRPRLRLLLLILGLLAAHVTEFWLFGVAAWLLLGVPGAGSLAGSGAVGLLDVVYLCATTYTTLGYGDLVPVGHPRFLFAAEALTGLLLIAWSASITFLEMQRHWEEEQDAQGERRERRP